VTRAAPRPHLLAVDDGPFDKRRDTVTPLVAVLMEGADLVEGVAIASFPIDGAGVTEFLAGWIGGLRFLHTAQAVVLGGITLAGLAVVDVPGLAAALARPVVVVNRREPSDGRVGAALRAAGLADREALLGRAPLSVPVGERLWAACAGAETTQVRSWLEASRHKSALPEPLRLAHLIAAAVASGSSRGRA
jgi:uncharacterized protein